MSSRLRLLLPLLGICTFLAGCRSESADTQSPEAQLEAFSVADDWQVNLFAAEPMVVNPVQMTFDPEGRLWVVNTPSFVHLKPGLPNDFISVLEDTDNDGRADKQTVFADGLNMPIGLELGDGGVYVVSQPHLLFLKDTDGDLKADERRVLLSGFGSEDNHHAISTFRWGPGGHLYFQSGIFLHSQVETPHGVVQLDNGGIFEFSPRKLKLDIFFSSESGMPNPWGHSFDRWGQNFLHGAAGGGIYYLTPGSTRRRITPREALPRVIAPLTSGAEFLSGRHVPEEMRGDLVLNDPKSKVVHRFRFTDDGSGFNAEDVEQILASPEIERRDHLQTESPPFRPVDVKMGPDGAVYIVDFHSLIIGHMTYNFRDPRRDQTHGRIWRLTVKDRPLEQKVRFLDLPLEELLEHLKSPFDYNRHQARRVLYDRPPEAVAQALSQWVRSLDPKDPEYEHHLTEALWAYQTVDVVEPELLRTVLRARDGRARAAATRVLRYWLDRIDQPLPLLETLIRDEHPRVRLEAIAALSYVPSTRAAEIALRALDQPMDRFLTYALRLAMVTLEPHWYPVWESGRSVFQGSRSHLEFALRSLEPSEE